MSGLNAIEMSSVPPARRSHGYRRQRKKPDRDESFLLIRPMDPRILLPAVAGFEEEDLVRLAHHDFDAPGNILLRDLALFGGFQESLDGGTRGRREWLVLLPLGDRLDGVGAQQLRPE